ncbi:DUF3833 family protein [Pararhizobium antarcticum]|uniref:DUF3833 domain-containing protein n=1 Tax=Pararhizobium antarcticum TaxID=1798805 RepID=A0A657LVN9_9HYPH|nr:DUF3833 family protein [Pararhizobium antarcticum]OJF97852.1 hypothetical protein AX761_13810 [Rhizobium sp. 58]OJF98284.1 hypothetical protein AX760_15060 [Pararhizobium antarcticum]
MKLFLRSIAVLASVSFMPGIAAAADTLMETFFVGRTTAVGSFSAINGVNRTFVVLLTGRLRGDTLTLREDFVYDDGEKDRKTWIFVRTGPNTYRGTREDVIGTTTLRVSGNTARFNYLVDLDPGPEKNVVRFYDRMVLSDDGKTIVNTATVWKYILPVARVRVDFKR